MSVERLAEALRWTETGNNEFDWVAIESRLGVALPTDYVAFVEAFPPGNIGRTIRILRPDATNGLMDDYCEEVELVRRHVENISTFNESIPRTFFLPRTGLLPWGVVDFDLFFLWDCSSADPDDWNVVIVDSAVDWYRYRGTMTELLTELATGTTIEILSGEVESMEWPIRFYPSVPEAGVVEVESWTDFWTSRTLAAIEPTPDWQGELSKLPRQSRTPGGRMIDWFAVETLLAHSLPTDYKEIIEEFGPGSFGPTELSGPLESDVGLSLLTLRHKVARFAAERAPQGRSIAWAPFFPAAQGAIPWGEGKQGWLGLWLPSSLDPDEWNVAIISPNWMEARLFRANLSTFLLAHLRNPGMLDFDF